MGRSSGEIRGAAIESSEKDRMQKEIDVLRQRSWQLHENFEASQKYHELEFRSLRLALAAGERKIEDLNSPEEDLAEAAASRKPRTESTEHEKTENGTYPIWDHQYRKQKLRGNPKLTYMGELSIQGHDTRLEDEGYRRRDGKIRSNSGEAGLSGDRPEVARPRKNPPNHPASVSATRYPHIAPAPVTLSRSRSVRELSKSPQPSEEEVPPIAPTPLTSSRSRSIREPSKSPHPSGEEPPHIALTPLTSSRFRTIRERFGGSSALGREST
ncbi:MAG: hypothetical protein M1840_007671 [Geoglossum simile]|nr:MAG: hypothetical protein M1840_007671 [Geoglossum simile]